MAGLKPPRVPRQARPGLRRRGPAAPARAARRDAALIAVFRPTAIRLSELAGIRYDAEGPGRSDVDLWQREITVQGKGRKTRVVKISFDAAPASTGTSASVPGTPRRTGRGCGSGPATGGR